VRLINFGGAEYALKDGYIDNPDFHFFTFLQTLESEFHVDRISTELRSAKAVLCVPYAAGDIRARVMVKIIHSITKAPIVWRCLNCVRG
jgi:hypothetical protein